MVGVTVQNSSLETVLSKRTTDVDSTEDVNTMKFKLSTDGSQQNSKSDADDENVTLRLKNTSDAETNNRHYLALNGRCFSDGEGIEQLETLLDADDFPDEFWHFQRDSFIHRSYNERLLARKNANDYPVRPISVPNDVTFKRDSFIRQSFKSIRNSFSKSIRKKNGVKRSLTQIEDRNNNNNYDNSTNSDKSGSKSDRAITVESIHNVPHQKTKVGHSRNSSSFSLTSSRSTNSISLGFRSAPTTPMAPLQSQSDGHVQSTVNLNSLSRSPSHLSAKIDSKMSRDIDAKQQLKILKFYVNGVKEEKSFSCLLQTGFIDKLSKCALGVDASFDKFSSHIDRVARDQKYRRGSKEYKAVEDVKKEWCKELEVIRKCSDCYEMWIKGEENFFTEVCRKPHLLVFARDSFAPDSDKRWWPGKLLSVDNVNDMVTVDFFGDHLRAEYKLDECLLYSAAQATALKSLKYPKKMKKQSEFKRSFEEVDKYIENVKTKFGSFVTFAENVTLTADIEKHLNDMYPSEKATASNCAKGSAERVISSVRQASADSDDSVDQNLPGAKRLRPNNVDEMLDELSTTIDEISKFEEHVKSLKQQVVTIRDKVKISCQSADS